MANRHFQTAFATESTIPALLENGVIDSPAPLSLLGRVKHIVLALLECIPVAGLVIAFADRFFNRTISPFQVSEPLLNVEGTKTFVENLNKYVVPLYRAPYPNGHPRAYHGVAHAMRTVLFAIILSEIYSNAGFKIFSQPADLYLSAGLHDVARKDDGPDLWDEQSGEKCEEILKQLGSTATAAAHSKRCIAEKDNSAPTSLEQKIIHDADCLEIIRCLDNPAHFRSSELRILKDLPENERSKIYVLIWEAKQFIYLTDKDPEIKSFIDKSDNPLLYLVQILRRNQFPVMTAYLGCLK